MKLRDFIEELRPLAEGGYGNLEVYYRHGASGDCGLLSGGYVTDRVDECGPFDLKDKEQYISIYAGD